MCSRFVVILPYYNKLTQILNKLLRGEGLPTNGLHAYCVAMGVALPPPLFIIHVWDYLFLVALTVIIVVVVVVSVESSR